MTTEHELTLAERRIYDLVSQGDVMCKQISHLDSGAIPSLIRKGLVEVYSRKVSTTRDKRLKFLRKV